MTSLRTYFLVLSLFVTVYLQAQELPSSGGSLVLNVLEIEQGKDTPTYFFNVFTELFSEKVDSLDRLYLISPLQKKSPDFPKEAQIIDVHLVLEKKSRGKYRIQIENITTNEILERTVDSVNFLPNAIRSLLNSVSTQWVPELNLGTLPLKEEVKLVLNRDIGNTTMELSYFIPPILSTLIHNYATFIGANHYFSAEKNYSSGVQAKFNRDQNFNYFMKNYNDHRDSYEGLTLYTMATGYSGVIPHYFLDSTMDDESLSMTTTGRYTYTVGLALMHSFGMTLQQLAWFHPGITEHAESNLLYNEDPDHASPLDFISSERSDKIANDIELYNNLSQAMWFLGGALIATSPFIAIGEEHYVLQSTRDRFLHTSGLTLLALSGTSFSYAVERHFNDLDSQNDDTYKPYLYAAWGLQVLGLGLVLYPLFFPHTAQKTKPQDKALSFNIMSSHNGDLTLAFQWQL